MVKKNIKQNGGDGYVVNVNESIGGRPSFPRYSNNYRPIFDGELLQNDGNNYSNNDIIEIVNLLVWNAKNFGDAQLKYIIDMGYSIIGTTLDKNSLINGLISDIS
jgi:hypothetical protein